MPEITVSRVSLHMRAGEYCDFTPESRNSDRRSLLGNDSLNKIPRQRIRKQQLNTQSQQQRIVFSAWSVQRGYKEEFRSWQEQHGESRALRRQPAGI
jgi:hypothetical protein